MLRAKKEITERSEQYAIIKASQVMYLSMCMENMPYVVPMSFGCHGEHIYFHCAPKGLKLDILENNPRVCAVFTENAALDQKENNPCAWGFHFRTVIVQGEVRRLSEEKEKQMALQVITDQYAQGLTVPKQSIEQVEVWKIRIEHMTGKRS